MVVFVRYFFLPTYVGHRRILQTRVLCVAFAAVLVFHGLNLNNLHITTPEFALSQMDGVQIRGSSSALTNESPEEKSPLN